MKPNGERFQVKPVNSVGSLEVEVPDGPQTVSVRVAEEPSNSGDEVSPIPFDYRDGLGGCPS